MAAALPSAPTSPKVARLGSVADADVDAVVVNTDACSMPTGSEDPYDWHRTR